METESVLIFAIGAAAGAVASYFIAKRKIENLARKIKYLKDDCSLLASSVC